VGFAAFLGDPFVYLNSHDDRQLDLVFDPEGRDGFYPFWSVSKPDVGVESR